MFLWVDMTQKFLFIYLILQIDDKEKIERKIVECIKDLTLQCI